MFLVCRVLGRGPVLWIWRFLQGIVYTLNAHTIHWSNWAIKQYVGVQRHMSDLQDFASATMDALTLEAGLAVLGVASALEKPIL